MPKAGGGRSQAYGPTPAAAEILDRLRPVIRAVQDRIMAPLSDREREVLIDLLARVIKAGDVKAGGG